MKALTVLSVVLSALALCGPGLTSGEHLWPVLSAVTAEACGNILMFIRGVLV